jgi:glycosyltransferase involved in cell wall biosynthesis
MKILLTQETDWLTKTIAQQHHLGEMLALEGHEIRVIDFDINWHKQGKRGLFAKRQVYEHVSKILPNASVKVIRPGIVKIPILVYLSLLFTHRQEIKRQIAEFSPDVIVGFGILNSYVAMRETKRNNIPFVYYWIDVLDLLIPTKLFQPIGRWVESATLKRSDCVLAINEKLKDLVLRLGAPPQSTFVVKAGVDFSQFQVNDYSNVRNQYNIQKGDFVLFFMGWLYHFSGLKEVALQLAKFQRQDVKLLIVGDGDAFNDLQQIQVKYNLHNSLILTGKRPYTEIPAFVGVSDICLLPAYPWEKIMQDIVPIKMYEYMAMGKPVIATKLPGVITEFGLDHGVEYVDCPEEALARAIQLSSTGKINELGEKARQFVEGQTWVRITAQFKDILEEVVKEKKNR